MSETYTLVFFTSHLANGQDESLSYFLESSSEF